MAESLAQARKQQKKRPQLSFEINNETAAGIVSELSKSLAQAFQMMTVVMQDQNRMLQQVIAASGHTEVLSALKAQNQMIEQLVQRPIQVEASNVEINSAPRATRFEFELNAQGVPVALVAMEYDED